MEVNLDCTRCPWKHPTTCRICRAEESVTKILFSGRASAGFALKHPDDHVVVLLHEGERIARFSQMGAAEKGIQAECDRHLALYHGWDGVLWQF